MRASDADRDVVLGALGEAYAEGRIDAAEFDERTSAVQAARTLGELPAFLNDLVPAVDAPPTAAMAVTAVPPLTPERVEAEAVARWEKSRREALSMWVFVSVICWVIYLATTLPGLGHPWPVYPMLGTSLPLLGTMLQRKDMIEQNRKRIVAKHEKAIAKSAKREALERRRLREIEGHPDDPS